MTFYILHCTFMIPFIFHIRAVPVKLFVGIIGVLAKTHLRSICQSSNNNNNNNNNQQQQQSSLIVSGTQACSRYKWFLCPMDGAGLRSITRENLSGPRF